MVDVYYNKTSMCVSGFVRMIDRFLPSLCCPVRMSGANSTTKLIDTKITNMLGYSEFDQNDEHSCVQAHQTAKNVVHGLLNC